MSGQKRYLWVRSASVSCRAAWALTRALPHLQIEVLDLDRGPVPPPEGLARPLRVPCLYDAPVTLYESHAILRYLADASPFYPTDLVARAYIDDLMDYQGRVVNVVLQRCVLPIVYPELFGAETVEATSEMIVRELPNLHRSLRYLQSRLQKSGRYLSSGSTPTLADLSMASVLDVLQHPGVAIGTYPEIDRWLDSLRKESFWIAKTP